MPVTRPATTEHPDLMNHDAVASPTDRVHRAWAVTRAPVPDTLDDPAAWAVHAAARISRADEQHLWGHTDQAQSAQEILAHLRNQEHAIRLLLVATAPGGNRADDVVGAAWMGLPREANTHVAGVDVVVHPDHRGQGAGSALLEEAERIVAEHGRTTVVGEGGHRGEPAPGDPGAVGPPSGSGLVSASDPGAAFALRHGYALAQADRYSVLELPLDPDHLTRLHDDAAAVAGADYRLHTWSGGVPDAWLDQYAELMTRMSTDIPQGDLDLEEDPWDAARIRTAEAELTAAGAGSLTVVAEHVPTGRLVAFTRVTYPLDRPEVVFQEETLAVADHRGHRLGMLVKTHLLTALGTVRPQARRVHTGNAGENAFMLAINDALGFRPVGVYAMWQRHLTR